MKIKGILLGASVALGIVSMPALAQDDEGMSFNPVEIYACDYNEGQGPADLAKATAAWNKYSDEAETNDYFAMLLTPLMFGEHRFDVAWLGSWPSGDSMGAGLDSWYSEGGEVAEGFAKTLTCGSHALFASTELKSPPDGPPPEGMAVTFADCSANEGKSLEDVFGGMAKLIEYQEANGYTHGTWAMFPAYGVADAAYDFKLVTAHENLQGLGQAFDRVADGDWQVQQDIMAELMECDVARVYHGGVVRVAE